MKGCRYTGDLLVGPLVSVLQVTVVKLDKELACSARASRLEPRLWTSFYVFHKNYCNTQLWALAIHLLQCLVWLKTSTLQVMVNEYQPYGWVIKHGNGWMFSLQKAQSSSLQLGVRVNGHLLLTDFRSEDPKWTLAYGFAPQMITLWISSWVYRGGKPERCCWNYSIIFVTSLRAHLDSMSSRSRLRLGTRNMVSMMLHSVRRIADDDGENNAVRSHVLSSSRSGTTRRPPAKNTHLPHCNTILANWTVWSWNLHDCVSLQCSVVPRCGTAYSLQKGTVLSESVIADH